MITAIIRNKDAALILEFPWEVYDLYERLQSIGIAKSPKQIPLTDNEDEDIGVKLYSDSSIGRHLLLTLNEKNTVAEANMHRRHDGRCKCQQRWSCKNKDCNTVIDIADNDLLKELCELLEAVKPESIDKLNKKSFLPSDEVNRLNNEINRMFDSVEIDREVLRTKMFSCVSEKYSSLDNDLYTAKKLQLEFERPITDDWMQKFNRTVREIRMHRNKAIGVVLLNGQIIGKEQKNGTSDCNKSAESGSCN